MINKSKKWLVTALVFFTAISYSYSIEFRDSYFATGIITTKILGDNPNTKSVSSRREDAESITGAGYRTVQSGIEFRFTQVVDEDDRFRIPVALEYTFFRSKDRFNGGINTDISIENNQDAFSFGIGFQYNTFKIRLASARIYSGIDLRGYYILNRAFIRRVDYEHGDRDIYLETDEKGSALRFAPAIKFGIDGKLFKDLYINTSAGFSFLNLLGKDDERGELFTPTSDFESGESNVFSFQFSLLLQYRI